MKKNHELHERRMLKPRIRRRSAKMDQRVPAKTAAVAPYVVILMNPLSKNLIGSSGGDGKDQVAV